MVIKRQIKGLSITQPWASAIVLGSKRIENRTWRPPEDMMGEYLALHASKSTSYFDLYIIKRRFGLDLLGTALPQGAIIAVEWTARRELMRGN